MSAVDDAVMRVAASLVDADNPAPVAEFRAFALAYPKIAAPSITRARELLRVSGLAEIGASWEAGEGLAPIPMRLQCPKCGTAHVDAPDPAAGWSNPPHRSHLCAACGCVWRPADVATVGVASIATSGTRDTWDGRCDRAPPGHVAVPATANKEWADRLRQSQGCHIGEAKRQIDAVLAARPDAGKGTCNG